MNQTRLETEQLPVRTCLTAKKSIQPDVSLSTPRAMKALMFLRDPGEIPPSCWTVRLLQKLPDAAKHYLYAKQSGKTAARSHFAPAPGAQAY